MTWSKFHRNCIITGPLDAFCLVCENHIRNEDEGLTHLEKSVHKKNLDATLYYEKYKNDHIRKVKKGYYCEFCNNLFYTAAKVGLHVAEPQHTFNKGLQLLRRVGNSVCAFDNVMIEEKAWNGFVEDTCVLCNMEFENEDIHKTEQSHVLNLIQKKLEFADNSSVYRNIDESSYQCLTCNLVLASNTFLQHFGEPVHKKKVDKCREAGLKALKSNRADTGNDARANSIVGNNEKQKLNKALIKPQQSKSKEETAQSKKRTTSELSENKMSTKISRESIKTAIEMDKYICDVLDAKNYVTRDHRGHGMCLLCDWMIEYPAAAIHVNSRHHLTMLRLHKDRLARMSSESKKETEDNDKSNDAEKDNPSSDSEKDKNADILEALPEFEKNEININFETSVATCKKCSKNINMELDAIHNHIKEHKNKDKKAAKALNNDNKAKENGKKTPIPKNNDESSSRTSSMSSTREDCLVENFALQNRLTYTNGKVVCQYCNLSLPSVLKSLKDHVEGAQHKSKVYKNDPPISLRRADLRRKPMREFITSLIGVENLIVHDVVINEKYNLNVLSFLMITMENSVLKCEPCEQMLQPDQVDAHKASQGHGRAMIQTAVITNLDSEFVREVRPGVFHCGFCSRAVPNLEVLEDHLNSISHKESKNSSEWRLKEHLNEISQKRWLREQNWLFEKNFANFLIKNMMDESGSSDDEYCY